MEEGEEASASERGEDEEVGEDHVRDVYVWDSEKGSSSRNRKRGSGDQERMAPRGLGGFERAPSLLGAEREVLRGPCESGDEDEREELVMLRALWYAFCRQQRG